jgi:hypothetical protein
MDIKDDHKEPKAHTAGGTGKKKKKKTKTSKD